MTNGGATASPVEVGLYEGPYEKWYYDRGKRHAFRPIRNGQIDYLTALADLGGAPIGARPMAAFGGEAQRPSVLALAPPLWRREEQTLLPFFFENTANRAQGERADNLPTLAEIAAMLKLLGLDLASGDFELDDSASDGINLNPRFRINFPLPARSVHSDAKTHAQINAPQMGAPEDWAAEPRFQGRRLSILGVIDDGVPFANKAYLDSTGATRIEYFWAQAAAADSKPITVPFGREFTRNGIDALRRAHPDEDALYRQAGMIDREAPELGAALNRFASHGSIVLDIAAGSRVDGPLPDEVRVIAVQLPNTIAWDTSGFGKDMFMLSAFHYIFERAQRIAKAYAEPEAADPELPLVVNFSYGFSGGGHDGRAELEDAIGGLAASRRARAPTAIVMPAGNNFNERLHAELTPARLASGSCSFNWRHQPNDRTPSFLEIWFPPEPDAAPKTQKVFRHRVEVTAPGGGGKAEITPGEARLLVTGDHFADKAIVNDAGVVIGQISVDMHRGHRWRVMIALAPTEPDDPALRAAAGDWRVTVSRTDPDAAYDSPILCWVQRDEDPAELGSGSRQSRIRDIDGAPAPFDPARPNAEFPSTSVLRRFGTLNGIATHPNLTVVAGYDLMTGRPAAYSAAGAVTGGMAATGMLGRVSCAAPSERSPHLPGVVGAGVRSGSRAWLSGTSAAAPTVARQLAKLFLTTSPAAIAMAEASNYATLLTPAARPVTTPEERARLSEFRIAPEEAPHPTPVGAGT